MPRVSLAPALARWLDPGLASGHAFIVTGTTVREVIDNLIQIQPAIRSYILDDQHSLRHHIVAYINDKAVLDKHTLSEIVTEDDDLFLFQALSGG